MVREGGAESAEAVDNARGDPSDVPVHPPTVVVPGETHRQPAPLAGAAVAP